MLAELLVVLLERKLLARVFLVFVVVARVINIALAGAVFVSL